MTTALRNFLITFFVLILVFAFVGYRWIYPGLKGVVDEWFADDESSAPAEESGSSGDTSRGDDSSAPVPDTSGIVNENGDVFTAVVMSIDYKGSALICTFIDANAKTERYIRCSIPVTSKVLNSAGVSVPFGDCIRDMDNDSVCALVTAMTGIDVDYCLRFDRESIAAVASVIPGASITLKEGETLRFVNPIYEDYEFTPDDTIEDHEDYYLEITNDADGRVLLNETLGEKKKLEWLLEYNPNNDGSEYNAYYNQICRSLFEKLYTEPSVRTNAAMSRIVQAACSTNLSTTAVAEHIDTIFAYNDYAQRYDISYPGSWESAVSKLRAYDGRYE